MKFWNLKTFFVLTGAGREGFGRSCALKFAENVGPGSMGILLARNEAGLEETKKLILENTKVGIKISTMSHDLAKPDGNALEASINKFLSKNSAKPSDFEHAMIVHGVMMLGSLTRRALEINNVQELQRYFSINAFSPVVLNSHFMSVFHDDKKMRTVLSVTSDGALRPYNALSYFCAASTARESFMCVTAKEEPSILVLNYNPGPLDIHMERIKTSSELDLLEYRKEVQKQGKVITCEQSVEKLVKLLGNREFFSGEHVQFNDLK